MYVLAGETVAEQVAQQSGPVAEPSLFWAQLKTSSFLGDAALRWGTYYRH